MRRRDFLVALGTASAGLACRHVQRPRQPTHPDLERQIDGIMRQALADHGFVGAHVAIAQRGELWLARGYGQADRERSVAVDTNTVFRIGSLTKQFTAAVVLRLAASGRLDIEAPIAKHLPFMATLPALSALELLNHTAGLHDDEASPPLPGTPSQIELAQAIARQPHVFDFDPGTAWLYSNANYIMLGALIEAVTGGSLANAYLELAGPLGLRATAMDHIDDKVVGAAVGYTPASTGDALGLADLIDIAQAGGAGAMRSTASELCRWHAALLDGRVLAEPQRAMMLRPGRLRDGRVSGANRHAANDANYGDVQYACGLLVSPPTDAHPSILHYGYVPGYSAMLQTYLHSGITMAVLCNADGNPALPFRAIRQAVVALDI